jgi:hypothetical protein
MDMEVGRVVEAARERLRRAGAVSGPVEVNAGGA